MLWLVALLIAPVAMYCCAVSAEAGAQACRIHGRLVDADGEPIVRGRLGLMGTAEPGAEIQSADGQDPYRAIVFSGEDGCFEIIAGRPLNSDCALSIHATGYAAVDWVWPRRPAWGAIDLGDITLEPPGPFVVYLMDGKGEPLGMRWTDIPRECWTVTAQVCREPDLGDFHPASGSARAKPDTGDFRFGSLAPGKIKLLAFNQAREVTHQVFIDTVAGQVTEIELVHGGSEAAE